MPWLGKHRTVSFSTGAGLVGFGGRDGFILVSDQVTPIGGRFLQQAPRSNSGASRL